MNTVVSDRRRSSATERRTSHSRSWLGRHAGVWLVVLLVIGSILVGGMSSFLTQSVTLLLIWVLLSQGWNIVSGYAGPLALGQAAFFGLSDFTTLWLFANHGISQYMGALLGVAVSVALAFVIGWITLRRPAFLFSVASLLVPMILLALLQYWGFYQIQRPYLASSDPGTFWFSSMRVYMYVAAVIVVIAAIGTSIMSRRRFGRFLVATRENGRAAEAAGIPTFRCKLQAYMIAATLAAVAGVLYAQVTYVFDPTDVFDPSVSTYAFLLALLGGAGTVAGPMLGGVLLIPIRETIQVYVTSVAGLDLVIFGALIIVVAMWLPKGLYPHLVEWGERGREWMRRRGRDRPDHADQVRAAVAGGEQ